MHSPFKAIFWKEWKQTAMLRRVSILLMVLVPPFIILFADSASRGWIPMFSVSSYDITQLFMDAIPMIMAVAWIFFAALFTAQVYAGDRAAGNEPFLLERPVARTVTWRSRLAAVIANGLTVLVTGWLIWLLYFLALGEPREGVLPGLAGLLLGIGFAAILVVICGSLAGAAFLDSPMIAVLGGLVLAVLPIGAGIFLGGLSPFAVLFRLEPYTFPTTFMTLSNLPVGMILPILLYPAYIAVSWFTLCRGEPAGRGSRARAAWVLVPSILGVLILFLILAPIAVRANVKAGLGDGMNFPSPVAGRCVALGGWQATGGWLLDTETGEKLRFFSVPTTDVVWREDGKFLAVNEGKTFIWPGSFVLSLKIVDGETGDDLFAVDFPNAMVVWDIAWIGDKAILSLVDMNAWIPEKKDYRKDATHIYLAEEGAEGWKDGTVRELDHTLPIQGIGGRNWRIVQGSPGSDRAFFVHSVQELTETSISKVLAYSEKVIVGELHLEENSLHLGNRREVPGGVHKAWRALSPSGSYWSYVFRLPPEAKRNMSLIDMTSGETVPLTNTENVGYVVWLKNDELLWSESAGDRVLLHRWKPGEGRSVLFETKVGERLGLDPSPDRGQVLLSVYRRNSTDETARAKMQGTWIYRNGSGQVLPSGLSFHGSASGVFYTRWADSETVLWGESADRIYFENLNRPGELIELR